MTVGVLQLELSIPDAMSLKDKRRVVKSLKDRIAHGAQRLDRRGRRAGRAPPLDPRRWRW